MQCLDKKKRIWIRHLVVTVDNCRKTNKQLQLQKQAQNKLNIFFMIYYHPYYLLSIIYYQ